MNIHVSMDSVEDHQQEDDLSCDSDSSVYEECLEEFFHSCESSASGDESVPESEHTVFQFSPKLTWVQQSDASDNGMEDEDKNSDLSVSPSAWLTAEEEDKQEIMVGYVFKGL